MSTQSSLLHTKGGLNVLYAHKLLYSEYEAEKGAEKAALAFLRSLKPVPRTLYIIPSPLLWYGAKLLTDGLKGETIVAIECDPGLAEISSQHEPPVPCYMSDDFSLSHMQELPGWPFRRVALIPLNGGYRVQKHAYDSLVEVLSNTLMEYWHNRMTLIHMVPMWIRNLFTNLATAHRARALGQLTTRKPVILAGAGESLEDLPRILGTRHKDFFLLAIDTALPFFMESGIEPDAVVSVDGQFYNFLDFVGTGAFEHTMLIADIITYPAIPRHFLNRTYLFMTHFWDTPFINRLNALIPDVLPAFGSVGIAGLEIAQRITSSAIYVCGLDYCYTLGKSHARGTTYGKLNERSCCRLLPMPAAGHQLSRGVVYVTARNGVSKLSDAALLGYRNLAARWPLDRKRIFTLTDAVLDMGIEQKPLETQIPAGTGLPDEMNRQPKDEHSIFTEAACKTFLATEFELLNRLYEVSFDMLEKGITEERLAIFVPLATECDYPALHITDMDIKAPDAVQLKRLLMAIALYRKPLTSALLK